MLRQRFRETPPPPTSTPDWEEKNVCEAMETRAHSHAGP